MEAAPKSAKSYDVESIVGERGRSRATKHYLVKYAGYDDSWWQPAKNLYCTDAIKKWDMLSAEGKALVTAQASVANPEEINLIMDLSIGKQHKMGEIILSACEKDWDQQEQAASSAGITNVQYVHQAGQRQ